MLARALALCLGSMIALGFARFNYALVLPAMKRDFAWTYTQAGALNTSNAIGYLLGALTAAGLIRQFSASRVFAWSTCATAILLILTALGNDFVTFLLLRFLPGLSGAWVFVAGGVLVSHVAQQDERHAPMIMGIFYGGTGIGIALSGVIAPFALESGVASWRAVWIGMGAFALIASLYAVRGAHQVGKTMAPLHAQGSAHADTGKFTLAGIGYFLFAVGLIIYMTFMIARVRETLGTASAMATFWGVLGVCCFLSFFPWRRLVQSSTNGRALAILIGLNGLATAMPLAGNWLVLLCVSAALFGLTFVATVTSTTALVRKGLPPAGWNKGIALFTICFGAGQAIGPYVGGYVSDHYGGLRMSLVVAAAVLLTGAVIASLQRHVSVAAR